MLKHALIAVSYGMLAVAVGLVSPELAPGITPPVNWIAAGLVFLGGTVAHECSARAAEGATMGGQIYGLRSENAALREQIDRERTLLIQAILSVQNGNEGVRAGGN